MADSFAGGVAPGLDEARSDRLLAAMSVEDKVAMAAGSGLWYSTPLPQRGIAAFKMSDGPNGVRGDSRTAGITSTCFPVGTALGASWDVALIGEIGAALAAEARAKDVDVLLGPTINLHRSPLAGRNFECYSEDPHLTAELAIAYTRGVQGSGVAVCLKHFVCNDSEFQRHSISCVVDARTLHELYLLPFERAIHEAGAWTVMSAYNRLDGVHCSASEPLLTGILKQRWGFDGVVISDWSGTHDTVGPARAGLDLEMPGPPVFMGDALLAAVRAGDVDEAMLDDKVRRQLRLMQRTGRIDRPEHAPERSLDDPAHRILARRAAAAGMVLLQNEGALLPVNGVRRIALIGPNAARPQIQGGGSSAVSPHGVTTPLEGLSEAFPGVRIDLAQGCRAHRHLPLLDMALCRTADDSDRAGLTVAFHAGHALEGAPVLTTHPRRSELLFFGRFNDAVPAQFSARIRTWLRPRVSGLHQFSLISAGLTRLRVAGRELIDNWAAWEQGDSYYGSGSLERIGSVLLEAGEPVLVEVDFSRESEPALAGLRIGMLEPETEDLFAQAEALARDADLAVVVVGLDGEWETEGSDRVDMLLPRAQDELVRRVAAANPATVVVLNAGSPIDTGGFRDRVPAILQVWYPGQAFGAALGDVLCGAAEPGGRLPTTIPARYEDHPAFLNYPGEAGEVRYGEGPMIGYRGYQLRAIAPAWPFGHGLGYTRFEITETSATLDPAGPVDAADVLVRARLRNVGARPGSAVVQLYCAAPGVAVRRAPRTLCAFTKQMLPVDGEMELCMRVPRARFAYFDTQRDAFRVETGVHRFDVGLSVNDIRGAAELLIEGDD